MTRISLDAFTQGAKLLAGRDKTTATLRADLSRRGYAAADVEAAIARLTGLRYLDDARWGAARAKRELEAGWGEAGVLARLLAAGLEPAVARRALSGAIDALGWNEAEAAQGVLRKRRLTGVKAARFLASRGFSADLVERLVQEP